MTHTNWPLDQGCFNRGRATGNPLVIGMGGAVSVLCHVMAWLGQVRPDRVWEGRA